MVQGYIDITPAEGGKNELKRIGRITHVFVHPDPRVTVDIENDE